MKPAILCVVIAAVTYCDSALARLGDTPQDAMARYGIPVTKDVSGKVQIRSYLKNHVQVVALFAKGKCHMIVYRKSPYVKERKSDGDGYRFTREAVEQLTDAEINALLKKNGAGKSWVVVTDEYGIIDSDSRVTDDGDYLAWEDVIESDRALVVSTSWFATKMAKQGEKLKERVAEASLQGF